ncbi:P-loop containing nucleoside triphosphate hydrolase protein [Lophiostoma macrostomum CBS 122681]|uniref:P-loop containing nucleoside triphosphate hydrolase protein n=1 Tax=Lophiostoma macrostomum CBS 122681 TaxID=1314788 RepID=A0A6A6T0U6_9PLEO|nr:P-loop containing nucleoside triphosphate hydrolase protein [Lophiostoma macrostomum CBS 122681]
MSSFIPRTAFPPLPSLPRSYFLGHHKSGLQKMKSLLSTIDLVLECRDYRIPLTSRNPLFEDALEGKPRVIVYTHRDLGGHIRDKRVEDVVSRWHEPVPVLYTACVGGAAEGLLGGGGGEKAGRKSVAKVLAFLREHAEKEWKLVGHRVMVVGMPNVGKSTLLNALRVQGVGKGKAARAGAQPGVTRKVGTGVKIIASEDDEGEADDRALEKRREKGDESRSGFTPKPKIEKGHAGVKGVGGGVYLLDTPGVFIPYVPDSEAMMRLALCGSVKDTIIPPVMLADYLLHRINLAFFPGPSPYAEYCPPTNDIVQLLEAIARKTGRLSKGGTADTEAAALWMIQRWRNGHLGTFVLDDVKEESLQARKIEEEGLQPSMNQARKADKERRREKGRARAIT